MIIIYIKSGSVAAVEVKGKETTLRHYQEQSKSVQIVYRNNRKQEILTRVYFPKEADVSTNSINLLSQFSIIIDSKKSKEENRTGYQKKYSSRKVAWSSEMDKSCKERQ